MEVTKATFWDFVKGICAILFVFGLSLKIYNMTIAVNVDFPTLLSLILALFSVALSALFYFKATETSNTFYDNTYKFTRDTAQLLAKMESGFGERLRNLDEGYSSMRGYIQNGLGVGSSKEGSDETAEKLRAEKEEIQKVVEERNQIVQSLIERSQLEAEEKQKIINMLKDKESELAGLQKEVTKLQNRRTLDRVRMHAGGETVHATLFVKLERYIAGDILESMGGAERVAKRTIFYLKRNFTHLQDSFSGLFLKDMKIAGFWDEDGLTQEGAVFIREVARDQVKSTLE